MLTLTQFNAILDRTIKGIETCGKSSADLSALSRELNMDTMEHAKFQELKTIYSEQSMDSKASLSRGLGMLLYRTAGRSPNTFNRRSLAIKVVVTQVFKALMERHIRERDPKRGRV